ncbi:beta-1,3-galactosyltransferase 5-like [Choristoneura fumiferana]|uniref:beta-1,3-galactosyltransferase 5-like n=1 Tax=Choristoneura fumiferana TaxID=7141 RepID=UPI003D15A9EB
MAFRLPCHDKMQRRLLGMGILSIIILIYWIYWSQSLELNNMLFVLKLNNTQFIRDLIIQPSNAACRSKPYIIIIVTSYVGHVELRSAHRRAIPKELLDSMNVTRIFLLAKIPPHEKYINQNAIEDESRAFGDILQGSFIEDYRNLTFKHLMGLQWASTNCSEAFYILKVDDDTVFNLERTYKLLKSLRLKGDFFMGYMLNNTKPIRKHLNKWYVTWEEYPRNDYPPYLSGWYYITTPNAARRVTNEAIYHPYFWIDDLLITGLLTEALNIKLVQVPKGFWLEYYELLECCLRDMIKEKIMCDATVGPNGGRNNLIVEFNDALNLCWSTKNCSARTKEKDLSKVCVAYRARSIFSDGKPEIKYLGTGVKMTAKSLN